MHWRSMMESKYICAYDLNGRDVTLTIERVVGGELEGEGGRKTKKPLCYFRETKSGKPLGLNATNCKTIEKLYGSDVSVWAGERVTLYPTTTEMGGKTVDCVRVRPRKPPSKQAAPSAPDRPDHSDAGDPEPLEPGSNG